MFKYFEPNKIFSITSKAPRYVLILLSLLKSQLLFKKILFGFKIQCGYAYKMNGIISFFF